MSKAGTQTVTVTYKGFLGNSETHYNVRQRLKER